LLKEITARYAQKLDETLQAIVDTVADEPEYGVMMRYMMGWVNADGTPYHQITGKRLRPTLLLLCCEAANGTWETALPAAAAVEILHNFSLIHDDIQDNSYMRHNRPTVWKIWGMPSAINAGDAMFVLAYHALASLSNNGIPAEHVLTLWNIFNATNLELTRGQHLDMRFESQPVVSVDKYLSMIGGKSAALIATSAQMGAYIGTLDGDTAQHYADFGYNLGIAFQIHDDILGIWGDPNITGKSAATDIISRKKSLPILHGLSHSEELMNIYQKPDFGDADVQRAVEILDQLNTQDYTREQELIYYNRAMEALEKSKPNVDAAKQLQDFVQFLFKRTF